jgi:hypothetical protein
LSDEDGLSVVGRSSQEETDFGLILFVVEQRWKDGGVIGPDEIATLIEMVGEQPLPKWLRQLACAQLRGKVRGRGRPPVKDEWQEVFLPLARLDYERMLRLLKKRAKRPSRQHRSKLDGSPHEKALEIVHRHYKKISEFKHIGLRRFRDLIFSS